MIAEMWVLPNLIVTLLLMDTTAAQSECYYDWVQFESSCYGFGEDAVTWAGASALCRIFDATLAEIETEAENNFLKAHARSISKTSLWIGGTDIFSEGYWIWSDSKKPVTGFTNWAPGEPNHSGGTFNEDCMQLYSAKSYSWNDEDCNLNSHFVCEVKLE